MPPRRISRLLAVQSLHRGIDAALAGEPVTACPYSFSGTIVEEFAAIWWVKGWRRTRWPNGYPEAP